MFSAASKTSSQPAVAANFIEDVFSTYLYKGTGADQTITNGIDLAGEGGLTWIKARTSRGNYLFDTVRGAGKWLVSNETGAQETVATSLSSFNSNGFSLGSTLATNFTDEAMCSWTFREQPKFFDVVTYTGDGTAGRTVSHSLGSVPGMIFVKRTDSTGNWLVYHRSEGATKYLLLNGTDPSIPFSAIWNDTAPTSSVFTLGNFSEVNGSGGTFVAYLFAHNAGGFGTSGTDNVISCGSFTTDGSGNATVNLGYEPQYILCKYTTTSPWYVFDVMRGFSLTAQTALFPNTSSAENTYTGTGIFPTATGFSTLGTSLFDPNATLIYMAIRRPMKVPTTGTSVFSPVKATATTPGFIAGFPVDMGILKNYPSGGFNELCTRLLGATYLTPTDTSAEGADSGAKFDYQNGWYDTLPANTYIGWNFARRPGFFDVVCYTGTGSATTQTHNLGVVPELMIVKRRNTADYWAVYSATTGNTDYLRLNTTNATAAAGSVWNNTSPTSTQFTVGGAGAVNGAGSTYVAYLFATCPGVSKVGSYTGNGGTQAIACGFTGGARFVMIKRTDATGSWYVYDTARGMTTLTDPYLLMESTAGEVATLGSVTTTTGGFTVNASILAAINTNAASYIFLAIA